jgi:hypothetical protein
MSLQQHCFLPCLTVSSSRLYRPSRISIGNVVQHPTLPSAFFRRLFYTFLSQVIISPIIFILTPRPQSGIIIKNNRLYYDRNEFYRRQEIYILCVPLTCVRIFESWTLLRWSRNLTHSGVTLYVTVHS